MEQKRGQAPFLLAAAAVAAALAGSAHAQTYPTRTVRIVVPLSPGGNVTIVTRALAQKMSEALGHQLIVDNRPGGNGVIGAEIVARSAPDGYTVLTAANSLVALHGLVAKVPYDPVKDFSGISLIATLPQALVVHPSVPARSVKELIALARARPEELVHATQGEASTGRIAAELFTQQTKARFLHVPYKGGGPAMIDLVGGQVSLMFATVSTALPQVKSGRIRALGLTSRERSPAFPDVPTIAEAGVPGYEALIWNVMLAPAGTPLEIRNRLHAEIAKALKLPELRQQFLAQGVELTASRSPDECTAFIKTEFDKHNQLWKSLGLTPR
jgi:tripartite-type tricarboxylate transporter receptor subunit TctC